MTIRVLLVDDHWEVRERLRILLMQEPDIELVGEAGDGAEALEVLERLPAEVVVMDLNLPEISGIETARRILADRPGTKVVIVSLQSDPLYVKESFKTGVTGYLLKECAFEELVEAVYAVAAGGTVRQPRDRSRCAIGGFRDVSETNQGFEHPNSGVPRFTQPHRSPYFAAKAFFAENGMHAIFQGSKGGKNENNIWTI